MEKLTHLRGIVKITGLLVYTQFYRFRSRAFKGGAQRTQER